MKIGESSNYDLEDLCNELGIKLNGIYCKDELEDLKKKNGCFIINMMDSKKAYGPYNVGHWVAFYKKSNSYAVYFDSMGCAPPNEIIDYIYQPGIKKVFYNEQQIQDIHDDYCGFISVMFLYWITKKNKNKSIEKKLESFIEEFKYNNLKNNKNIIFNFFKKL